MLRGAKHGKVEKSTEANPPGRLQKITVGISNVSFSHFPHPLKVKLNVASPTN